MPELPLALASLYAELHDLSGLDRPGQRRAGGFSSKRIGGRNYWYRQVWIGGRRRQKAIGPETPELLRHIARERREDALWRQEQRRRRTMCRALRAALHFPVDPIAGRIVAALAEAGIFGTGAMLVGTHAYRCFGPMLGVRLAADALSTSDIDLATDGAISVAFEGAAAVSLADVVTKAVTDFHVVPARPGARISHALKLKGAETRVELLTSGSARHAGAVRTIPHLGFGAQILPYLDYLLGTPARATYLYDAGISVTLPDPARYALHKLIVAVSRPGSEQGKAAKDLIQAGSLIDVLHRSRPGDLRKAAAALEKSGGSHLARARKGARLMAAPQRALLPGSLRS